MRALPEREPRNRSSGVVVAAGACLIALLANGAQASSPGVEFSPADRALFAEYRVLERDEVPVILAVNPARAASVVAKLRKHGARVIGRKDSIGYLYAWVPVDAVEAVPGIEGIQALQIASSYVRGTMGADEQAGAAAAKPKTIPRGLAPTSAMSAANPFTGEAATQALAFKTEHPTFDGRGVVTAFVEPVAPNLHTMQGALDLAGRPVQKFAHYDLGTTVEPAEPVADGSAVWQRTDAVTPDSQGAFAWRESSFRLPADVRPSATRWRMCRRVQGSLLIDKERYDVLWAVDLQRVWVLPQSAGTDFSKAQSVSLKEPVPWIAIGDAASRYANLMSPHAFVFAADVQRLLLASAVTQAAHAGMVGSVMAGAKFLGSEANGVAPAAQVTIYHAGRAFNAPSLAGNEQMIGMLSDPRVDVAQASYAVSDTSRFGGVPPQHFWAQRLSRQSGKPFIKAMGNYGARLFRADEFTTATSVFAVGAYTPRDTWLANFGIDTQTEHTLASYSGWGPADDGGLKPDFLGLTHTLTEGMARRWYWADAPGLEPYGVSGGTSAAAPNGAGHVAVLVSAAKQMGIPHDDMRLRAAIATTAKFIDGVEARAQGHGLIQVSDAWAALERAKGWKPAAFAIEAPLVGAENRAGVWERLTGRGLFELSGWRPGQSGRREITVTRTAGSVRDSRYRLRWKGDVRVFASTVQEIELPLGQAVKIPVQIQAGATSGSYSAILDLIDPTVGLVAGSVLCTVMVSDPLPADGSPLRYRRAAPRLGTTIFFVDVPAGLSAITVELNKDDAQSYWSAQDPTGRVMPFNPYGSETYKVREPAALKARRQTVTYADPVPGVWQFDMQTREPNSMAELEAVADWSAPIPLEVEMRGWAVVPDAVSSSDAGAPSRRVGFRGRAGDVDADIAPVGLGAARTVDVTLVPGLKPVFFDVTVDPGATKLEVGFTQAGAAGAVGAGAARAGAAGPGVVGEGPASARAAGAGGAGVDAGGAQIGLYVYKVPDGDQRRKFLSGLSDDTSLLYYDPSFLPAKRYALMSPPPGRYRIAVDPIRVPASGIRLAWRDTVYHPLYGSVDLAATADSKASDARVTVRAQPEKDRRLLAEVGLFRRAAHADPTALAVQSWFVTP